MPLYYMHSKAFHPLFNSILNKIANFQKVILYFDIIILTIEIEY